MEVIDCMALGVDQYVSLAFLAFVEHAGAADAEYSAICMAVEVESASSACSTKAKEARETY